MLETVLKIGNAFRKSESSFRNYRYIKQYKQDDKRKALILSLPVNINNDNSLIFDFDKLYEITDENTIENKLFYLTYKTSDSDGLVKYIFGDIYYSNQKEKEGGYYRLGDKFKKQNGAYKQSSFYRGEEDFKSIQKQYNEESNLISSFRKEFEANSEYIENIIKYKSGISECLKEENFKKLLLNKEYLKTLTAKNDSPPADLFLHFDFDGRHWYKFDNEIELINKKLIEEFTEKNDNPEGYVLKKALYKTIASAEKDFQFPYFQEESKYRVKLFQKIEDVLDLFYAIDYSKKALIKINDIKIIVLPRGNNITASQYEKFNQKIESLEQEKDKEDKITHENMVKIPDDMLFTPVTENIAENIIEFDLIFSKSGGISSPDIDMIEFSSIKKSNLEKLHQRIKDIKKDILRIQENELSEKQKETIKYLDIKNSFKNIFKDLKSDKKKYQSHLYKVLPQIYTGTYYNDPVLLPALIETTEKNIRSEENLSFPKYDFYFLTKIQNTIKQGEYLMSIKNSKSYQIGLLLGEIARQFAAWRNDCPIKSFEKSYIGTLSRRIATINDLIKFKSFIEEKLILHERSKFTFETSVNLAEKIKELELSTEKYDKNSCAFGFFESYFAQTKNEKQEATDNINETN